MLDTSSLPQDNRFKSFKLKLITGIILLLSFHVTQIYFWPGTVSNPICNNDLVIYSKLVMLYHDWVPKHWWVRHMLCGILNFYLGIFLNLATVLYCVYGQGYEAFLAILSFTYAKKLCGFYTTTYNDPIGNFQPGS